MCGSYHEMRLYSVPGRQGIGVQLQPFRSSTTGYARSLWVTLRLAGRELDRERRALSCALSCSEFRCKAGAELVGGHLGHKKLANIVANALILLDYLETGSTTEVLLMPMRISQFGASSSSQTMPAPDWRYVSKLMGPPSVEFTCG